MKLFICGGCDQKKPYSAKGLCKTCYNRCYYQEHREELLVDMYLYRQEHREERLIYMRRWHNEHREERSIYHRRWRKENLEHKRAYDRLYYQEHREKILTRARQRREKNPDYQRRWCEEHQKERAAYRRRWSKANPDKELANNRRRRARKRNLPNTLTPKETEQLLAMGRAMYPGEELHLDHVVPLSKGGGTTFANMQAIPARLNRSKKDALPQEAYIQIALE